MLTLKMHRNIGSLKNKWEQLQSNNINGNCGSYQSFYVQNIIFKRMLIYAIQDRYIPMYCEIIDDGKTMVIAPLCKYINSNNYCIIGNFNGMQVYDFIYDDSIDINAMMVYITFLFKELKADHIYFDNVMENSLLYQALTNMKEILDVETRAYENVNICFEKDYDEYFHSLSKHMRQNIRTAYNRLKNDNIEVMTEIYRSHRLKREKLNNLIDIYCDRHESRYDLKISKLKRFYLKYIDFSTVCQQKSSENFYAIVSFNGQIAGFMSGLYNKFNDSVIIPRLSIVDIYSQYSPGVVLINEVAKRFTSDIGIKNLDLSKGNEKYKLSMGGKIYNTYHIEIKRKQI